MATVVHGACSSPRQQHQCELSTGAGGCLSSGHHQHQHHHQHHQQATPIYSSVTKYLRPGTAPQLHSSPVYYCSSAQLPPSAPGGAAGESYRNYYGNTHSMTMSYGGGNSRHSKRKTAVQLLAETKPFYMKAEAGSGMVDRLQATSSPTPSYRKSFLPPGGLKRGRNSAAPSASTQVKYGSMGYMAAPSPHSSGDVERRYLPRPPTTTRETNAVHNTHAHHRHHNPHAQMGRHSTPTYNNNIMQSKLKLMLAPEPGRERSSLGSHASELQRKFELGTPVGAENCSVESPISYLHTEDVMAIPPPMFLSSQTFDDSYNYSVRENSSVDEPLVLTEDYRPISPPAEYAADTSHGNGESRGRYNYQRSYSHSHEMTGEHGKYDVNAFNINSHKSLPDLHSQISRHSPHSEILSCCSRGNRSIKSTGESSLNRDSGGSSGHYTHRSEPCYRQREPERETYDTGKAVCCNHANSAAPIEYRRDSGSSTQHSANSYCGYASPTSYGRAAAECAVCRCSRNSVTYDVSCDYLLNFPTPVVPPEAFQDDYTPPSPSVAPPQVAQQSNRMKLSEPRYYSSSSIDYRPSSQGLYSQTPPNPHPNMRIPPNSCAAQSPGSTPSIEDISPPPIQFKRQKCIRLKSRGRLPVPNPMPPICTGINGNAALAAATYNQHEPQAFLFPKCIAANADEYNRLKPCAGNSRRSSCERVNALPIAPPIIQNVATGTGNELEQLNYQQYVRENDTVSDLEHFFDRLGLNDKKYHEIYAPPNRRRHSANNDSDDSSTVFFSDVSTVDSMRLPDSTETQPQTTQPYRPSEPPSIVERNARIIKWLCNIKKLEQN